MIRVDQRFTIMPFELKLGVTIFRGRVFLELDEAETEQPQRAKKRRRARRRGRR
jgi:hypothetical protein